MGVRGACILAPNREGSLLPQKQGSDGAEDSEGKREGYLGSIGVP